MVDAEIFQRLARVEVESAVNKDRQDRFEEHVSIQLTGISTKLDAVIANQNVAAGAKQATTILGHLGSGLVGAGASIASIFTWFSTKH